MNERIKELERQATETVKCGLNGTSTTESFNRKKFAELIVEECIRELEISRKCDPYTGNLFDCEYNTCIKEQTTVLKEHFGVEE